MTAGGSARHQRGRRRDIAGRWRVRRAGSTSPAAATIFDERRIGDDGRGQWAEQNRDQLAQQRAQDGLVHDGDGTVVGTLERVLDRRAQHVV